MIDESFGFRALRREDFAQLSDWFGRPHVAPWWRESTELAEIEARYGPVVDGVDPTEVVVVELDSMPLGIVQWYRMRDNPEWCRALAEAHVGEDAAGMDYLIGDEGRLGRGLGPRMLTAFLDVTLPRYPEISSIALSVGQGNQRSWRMLERLGFVRVWAGEIVSSDPSDEGPSYVYVRTAR
jgi:aminoglycoside 6'-N-acetyltransferase